MTHRAARDLPPKQSRLFNTAFDLVRTRNQAGYFSGALLVHAAQHAAEVQSAAYTQRGVIARSRLNAVHLAAVRAVERLGTDPQTYEEIDAYYEAQQLSPLRHTVTEEA